MTRFGAIRRWSENGGKLLFTLNLGQLLIQVKVCTHEIRLGMSYCMGRFVLNFL